MVEIGELMEGEYMNLEFIKNSPTKRVKILTEGEITVHPQYGTKLEVLCEIDGKEKKWSLNMPTMANFKAQFGTDSQKWVGKEAALMITKSNGNECAVGMPIERVGGPNVEG